MSYQKLQVWEKGRVLVRKIYTITHSFPKDELSGITRQMRRAAVSIPSNIAEGSQRTSDKEFGNFILIARGSLAELETQCILSADLGFLSEADLQEIMVITEELSRMLHAFYSKLKA